MSGEEQDYEVARFYTRTRRFPRLIGRLHDGTKIPGGPYTVPQGVVFAIALALGLVTRGLWGTGSILLDLPLVALVAWGAAWGMGRVPATRRSIGSVALGTVSAIARPGAGRYKEQTVKLAPPYLAKGTTAIRVTAADPLRSSQIERAAEMEQDHAAKPEVSPPVSEVLDAQAEGVAARKPISGVERLLAQTHGSERSKS